MPTRRFGLGVRLAYPLAAVSQPKQAFTSLVDFLSIAQQQDVYFMPVGPQASLGALGRGMSGLVNQSIADVMTSFAFKQFVGSDFDDENFVDSVYSSIITEIMVMQHEPIKQSPHIVDLIGVCWDVDMKSKRVWPIVVTHKANCGDLEGFLFENRNMAPENRLLLCANIVEAVELLHSCGTYALGTKLDQHNPIALLNRFCRDCTRRPKARERAHPARRRWNDQTENH